MGQEPWQEAVRNNFSDVMLTNERDVLGFNEPEITGQSECTPQEAVDAWLEHLEPLRDQGYRLGSPAVTSGSYGSEWYAEWWRLCDGRCHPDFIALHWVRGRRLGLIRTSEWTTRSYGSAVFA